MSQQPNGEEGRKAWGRVVEKVRDGFVYQKCPLSVMEKNRWKGKREKKEWKSERLINGQPQSNTWKWKKKLYFRGLKQKKIKWRTTTTIHCGQWWKKQGDSLSLWCQWAVQYSVYCQGDHDTLLDPCPPFPESLSDTLSGGEDHAASLHWISTLLYSVLKHGTVSDINKEQYNPQQLHANISSHLS